MPLSKAQMDWAEFLRAHVAGEGQIAAFGRSRVDAVPVFSCRGERGLFAATMGLMNVNQAKPGGPPVYTELVLTARDLEAPVCEVLSTVAMSILVDGWRVGPGALLEGVVGAYVPSTRLPHLYFTFPDMYEEFDEVKLDGHTIHPLACYPASEAEAILVRAGRFEELEATWEKKYVDPLDWSRASAI